MGPPRRRRGPPNARSQSRASHFRQTSRANDNSRNQPISTSPMQIDDSVAGPSTATKSQVPPKIRFNNVYTQTDPVQVFPIPAIDPRAVVVAEEAKKAKRKLAEAHKIILEQRKKLYAQKKASCHNREIVRAVSLRRDIDKPVHKKPRMNRISGLPDASCSLPFPSGPNSPSDQLKTLSTLQLKDEYGHPPTPGKSSSTSAKTDDEDELLGSDNETSSSNVN